MDNGDDDDGPSSSTGGMTTELRPTLRMVEDVKMGRAEDAEKKAMSTLRVLSEEVETDICVFCKQPTVDELTLGPLYYLEGVVTHYFCMLFSSALVQRGADDEGILGFMPEDIMSEARRGGRLKCVHCNISGASVGCCNKKCREVYHYPCGVKNRANFQFLGEYQSFCAQHFKHPSRKVKTKDCQCPICMNSFAKGDIPPVVGSCCKAAVFHKHCIQRLALNAGYFFKCPMCNSSKFVEEMRTIGIYVPEQDASWEKDDAFQDLYVRYSKCDAETCKCVKGREHESQKGGWMLARCRLCGASGVHKQCGKLETVDDWACAPCLLVEEKSEEEKKKNEIKKKAENKAAKKSAVSVVASTSNEPGPSTAIVDHESTASGNRRGRDGYLNRQSPSPVKLTRIKIDKSCFSYFPHTKESIKRNYSNAQCLPDWRNLQLVVNVCDWIPPLTRARYRAYLNRTSVPAPPANSGPGPGSSSSSVPIPVEKKKRGPPRKREKAPEPIDPEPEAEMVAKRKKRAMKTSSRVTNVVVQDAAPESSSATEATPTKKSTSPVMKVSPIILTAIPPLSIPPPQCFTSSGRYLPLKRLALESAMNEPVQEKRFRIRTRIASDTDKKKRTHAHASFVKKKPKSSWSRGVVKKRKLIRDTVEKAPAENSPAEEAPAREASARETSARESSARETSARETSVNEPKAKETETPPVLTPPREKPHSTNTNATDEEVEEFPKTPEPTPEEELVFKALGDRLRSELSGGAKDPGIVRRRKQNMAASGHLREMASEEPEIIKVVYGKPKQVAKKLVWDTEGMTKVTAKAKAIGESAKPSIRGGGRSRSSSLLKTETSTEEQSCQVEKKRLDESENIFGLRNEATELGKPQNKDGQGSKLYANTSALKGQSDFLIAGNVPTISSSTTEEKNTLVLNGNPPIGDSETESSDSQDLPLSPVKATQTASGRFGRQINSSITL